MFCVVSSYAFASFWVAVRSIDRDTCPRSRTHDRRPELRSVVLGCGKYCQTKTGFIKKKMRSIRFFCLCGFRVAVSRPMVEGELKFSMTPRQRNGGVAHPDGSRCDDPDRVQRSVPARLPKAPEGLDGFVAPLDAAPAGRSATGATLHPGPNIYGYRTHAESAHGSHPEAMRRGAQIPGAFQIGPWGTPHFQFP